MDPILVTVLEMLSSSMSMLTLQKDFTILGAIGSYRDPLKIVIRPVMENNEKDKRICTRFRIEGATLSYKKIKLLSLSPDYTEKNCPVIDLSRGGCRFLAQKPIKINTKVLVEVSLPDDDPPIFFYGETKWFLPNPGFSYRYQVGIQFNAYGEDEKQNPPSNLDKIKELEQKCLNDSET